MIYWGSIYIYINVSEAPTVTFTSVQMDTQPGLPNVRLHDHLQLCHLPSADLSIHDSCVRLPV